jgi:hypothetical protein
MALFGVLFVAGLLEVLSVILETGYIVRSLH